MDLTEYKNVEDPVIRARKVAFVALSGIPRKKPNDTAFEHSARVAKGVITPCRSAVFEVVGYLHDVLEDSDMFSSYDIAELFGSHVAAALGVLTRTKGEPYVGYIRRCLNNPLSLAVKVADLEDNMRDATGTLRDKYQLAHFILQPW